MERNLRTTIVRNRSAYEQAPKRFIHEHLHRKSYGWNCLAKQWNAIYWTSSSSSSSRSRSRSSSRRSSSSIFCLPPTFRPPPLKYIYECRYVSAGRALISRPLGAVFVRCGTPREPSSPCTRFKTLSLDLKRERTEGKKKKEVLHLFRCYTHTYTRPEPGQPWKARGRKKADTRRANGQKQRRGGRGTERTSGTNLHGETDLTKTAHTPKPHDTLRRGTRGN